MKSPATRARRHRGLALISPTVLAAIVIAALRVGAPEETAHAIEPASAAPTTTQHAATDLVEVQREAAMPTDDAVASTTNERAPAGPRPTDFDARTEVARYFDFRFADGRGAEGVVVTCADPFDASAVDVQQVSWHVVRVVERRPLVWTGARTLHAERVGSTRAVIDLAGDHPTAAEARRVVLVRGSRLEVELAGFVDEHDPRCTVRVTDRGPAPAADPTRPRVKGYTITSDWPDPDAQAAVARARKDTAIWLAPVDALGIATFDDMPTGTSLVAEVELDGMVVGAADAIVLERDAVPHVTAQAARRTKSVQTRGDR